MEIMENNNQLVAYVAGAANRKLDFSLTEGGFCHAVAAVLSRASATIMQPGQARESINPGWLFLLCPLSGQSAFIQLWKVFPNDRSPLIRVLVVTVPGQF